LADPIWAITSTSWAADLLAWMTRRYIKPTQINAQHIAPATSTI